MPLNKLDNFIKNTEGRILYVSPSDLDATDSITNQGNSLTQPFKTVQRALIEAARFSYLKGNDNDFVEKTTILLFPGEHLIDNRPGWGIKSINNTATAIPPSGGTTYNAGDVLSLNLTSVFDLTQSDNILYKFNSIYGGVIVPRGTSIVGLDLRKTKIRPKYVPNPTDPNVSGTAIFRITGACYFWQLSFFDGDNSGLVYTDKSDFSALNQSTPKFSHHKLTCFEYADGTNIASANGVNYDQTDLDMYYNKLSNAYNAVRPIDEKYPTNNGLGFSKQRPEWEIVGAFASDPISISSIISNDGFTAGTTITVTTTVPHKLTSGTPIRIKGVGVSNYNISTVVDVPDPISPFKFTYSLPSVPINLNANPSASGATVTIETDTVSGASPYIFNCSLRSVYGMNGMHGDGSKASGFRSMVVAQFTGVSLQKDDRAFAKYIQSSRYYDTIDYSTVSGADLPGQASSTDSTKVYHLDSGAIYRKGWESVHVKISNDAFIQIVSVFAIGYNRHFDAESGADGSITNSNSNFGQISLSSDGFKAAAFGKDNTAYITSIVGPRAVTTTETAIDWNSFDVGLTTSVGISSHLYLYGFTSSDDIPPTIIQGYRIGARNDDKLYVVGSGTTYSASIYMIDNVLSSSGLTTALGTTSYQKTYYVQSGPTNSTLAFASAIGIQTGEKIRLYSDTGDLPENIDADTIYYAIPTSSSQLQVASSLTNSSIGLAVSMYGGNQLKVVSRVSDKIPGDIGSPIQYDPSNKNWYIHTNANNGIYNLFASQGVGILGQRSNVSYVKRISDSRSIDEKIYKLRVVIPKELSNSRTPVSGYVIQESSTTGIRTDGDFTLTSIGSSDYFYNRNPRFISSCTATSTTVTTLSELPHNLQIGDKIIVTNVTDANNTVGVANSSYNGTFTVASITNDKTFTYSTTDVNGVVHSPATILTNNINSRTSYLPRFQRNDLQSNYFIYRNEVITPYIEGTQDGVYHLYVLNAKNQIPDEFTDLKYSQNIVDLYPQLDRDNFDDNPPSAVSFAKRSPLGDVITSDLQKSITRETVDDIVQTFGVGLGIATVFNSTTSSALTFDRPHGLAGIVTYSTLTGGSGKTNGTYYNVKLFNEAGLINWDGATAKVTVSSNTVSSVDIISGGSGYTNGETLYFDTSVVGGTANAAITIATSGISSALGNTVQITGIGTTSDGYYRISSIPATNKISIAKSTGDPIVSVGQYALVIGPSIPITGSTYDIATGITTFTSLRSHGLLSGNRFKVIDSSNNNLGNFIVKVGVTTTTFSAITNSSLISPAYVLKHGLSSNNAISDSSGENIGVRDLSFYGNENLILASALTNGSVIQVYNEIAGISTTKRFPLGSYIQIDNEIMRITTNTLSGGGNNEMGVIRGVFGTIKSNHSAGAVIKKIKPIPIEFRRPSILRASGQTFEYLGYGPGNYSTGLPQVQVKTLSEREAFLVQSQQRSCGAVVYTGMNNDGDFFIGNTKYSSSSGQQKSFNIPNPTVTGQDPSRLSVVYDEVTVKERILVEGGNSGTILSQFDGPVTFNKELKMNNPVTVNDILKVTSTEIITNTTNSSSPSSGALVVSGGVGIGISLNVAGISSFANPANSLSIKTGSVVVGGGVGIEKNLYVGGTFNVAGVATFQNNVYLGDSDTIYLGDSSDLRIYHTGANSYIDDQGTGSLIIKSDSLSFRNAADDEQLASFTQNAAVLLYYDNSKKFETIGTGISVTGEIIATGDITAFLTSDQRLKENIVPIPNPLEKVISISGNTFDWVQGSGKEGSDIGVIAQEILEVLPDAVATRETGYLAVRYEKIIPLLIEAIKELKSEIDELKASK